MKALVESVSKKCPSGWIAIAIAEADYLSDMSRYETVWERHMIIRSGVEGGRAQKWIIHRKIKRFLTEIIWDDRCSHADFWFTGTSAPLGVSCIASHFGHGDEWDASLESCGFLLGSTPSGYARYLVVISMRNSVLLTRTTMTKAG